MPNNYLLSRLNLIRKGFARETSSVIGFFSCLLVFSLLPWQANAKDPDKFKPFKLKTLDGTVKTLHDYANKVTLVSFFFPGCTYCAIEMPEQQRLYDKYKDKGVSMIWINVVPSQEKVIPHWQQEHQFTIPVLVGESQDSLQRDYRLTETPTIYLLGEKGEVLYFQSGSKKGDEEIIARKIDDALQIAQ